VVLQLDSKPMQILISIQFTLDFSLYIPANHKEEEGNHTEGEDKDVEDTLLAQVQACVFWPHLILHL
jgi:hypothetical protein